MAGLEDLFGRFKDLRPKVEKAGFGKAPPIADVKREAADIEAFLGKTDYASRFEEQERLAKLQLYLAMAQRGFAAMGEAPRPGESSLGTLGRTLAAPLMGDVSTIAGQIIPLRIAAKAAEEKEARDIKLAAYTQARTRGKDIDAATLAIVKAYSTTIGKGIKSQLKDNVTAIVDVDGTDISLTTPVVVLMDKGLTKTVTVGENKVGERTIPSGTPVKSWNPVSGKTPTTKYGLLGQIYADGKFHSVSNITRVERFEGNKLTTDYYHQRPGKGWTLLGKGDFSEILPSHGPFEAGKTSYVSLLGEKEGNVVKALGDPSATANARIESYISRLKPDIREAGLPGLKDRIQYRYKNRNVTAEIEKLINTGAFQSEPLSQTDLQTLGRVEVTRESYINNSRVNQILNVGGKEIILGPGNTFPLSQTEKNAQSDAVKSALTSHAPVSAEPVTYTFKEKRDIGGKIYLPGHTIVLTPQAHRALDPEVQQALTTDPAEKAVLLKKRHIESLVDLIRKTEPDLKTATFEDTEMNAVLAQFPGAARGASAANALYDIIVSTMRTRPETPQDQARTDQVIQVNQKATTYQESIKEELKGAEKIYKGFQNKEALPSTPFNQLPYADQIAFARMSRRGLNLRNVEARWLAAKTALDVTRAKYTAPTAEDVAEFANKIKIRAMLQDILTNKNLKDTGIIEGIFSSLGATLADWPILGSKRGGEFSSTLQQLGANLRALSTDEGRPSNYRIGLIAATLPKFTTSETINTANVRKALATMDANIKSYFTDAVSSDKIVPQSFSRMAAEVGLKGLDVDQKKYWWLDPEVSAEEPLPFTWANYRRSVGEASWTLVEFNAMNPGEPLPLSAMPPSKTGDVQTFWVKAKDRKDGQRMIIETDRYHRPLPGAKPIPFVIRSKKEQ